MITDFEHMVTLSKLEHVQQILEKCSASQPLCPDLKVALGLVEELKEPYMEFFGFVLEEGEMDDNEEKV